MFFIVLVVLCGTALAMPFEDGQWVFPDELDDFIKKPSSFNFFQLKSYNSPKTDLKAKGSGGKESTTPLPDVLFKLPNCKCRYPPQYNPVCGSDGLSYVNAQMLKCARVCGNDVVLARMGTCRGRFSVDR